MLNNYSDSQFPKLTPEEASIIDDIRVNVGTDEADVIEQTIRNQQHPK